MAVHGITPTDRIRAVGMGASQPIADNRTRQGRAQNRRTELIILRK
jgi:flagellar motor protein MotB